MTGNQILILFTFIMISIIAFLYNMILSIILLLFTLLLANIFKAYNNYKRAEIEKEIYKEIKKNKIDK